MLFALTPVLLLVSSALDGAVGFTKNVFDAAPVFVTPVSTSIPVSELGSDMVLYALVNNLCTIIQKLQFQ